ncbi:MAG: glycogen debranching protein [Gemmatimonadaceae bacterium]
MTPFSKRLKNRYGLIRLGVLLIIAFGPDGVAAQSVLYQSSAFIVTDTSVRQGRYEAVAESPNRILSSYPRSGTEVHYKFSINSEENEFPPGIEHTLFLRPRGGQISTPIQTFGLRPPPHLPTPQESESSEEGTAQVTFRVDMRPVLRSFRERGFYKPPAGDTIRARDFRGVFVMGNPEPLSWDFHSFKPGSRFELTDPDGDTVYTVTLPIVASYTRPLAPDGRAIWERHADLSAFPEMKSPQRIVDALYRMSLEEMTQLVRPDGAFSAGAKWEGVWTRDISLSAILGLALVAPEALRRSLMAKVDAEGRIIQDTGTGGSWPMSTDRMCWALAAWEVYAATGDRIWLRNTYDIIRRSAAADLHAIVDDSTGLFRGESSFLDWREQSYPRWMDPKDIQHSEALGTNVIHYATYRVLADMAAELGEPAEKWGAVAMSVRRGINDNLWQSREGWFAQYRYGRNNLTHSPRAESLGEALTIIYGAAREPAQLASSSPQVAFGAPTIWPYIPNLPLYHNASIWPFVNAYWTWASAEAGNTAGVEHGLASVFRPAALFLTNKENMVASTGHFEGTVLNSDRQLWSVAGTLATVYRVLFGMRLRRDGLLFKPMVPPSYAGTRTLRNFHYREAVLTVRIRGFGNGVARSVFDGKILARPEVPAHPLTSGTHTLELEMNGVWPRATINLVEDKTSLDVPLPELRGDTLHWPPVAGAETYVVYRNAVPVAVTTQTWATVRRTGVLGEYQIRARSGTVPESFLSEPLRVINETGVTLTDAPSRLLEHQQQGFTGGGYVTLSLEKNTALEISTRVATAGVYALDARYANGNGPINTGDKAAIRTVLVDGKAAGVLVMPHRGSNVWNDWGYTNPINVRLARGKHTITIKYTALDENMNRKENTALLDHVRLTRIR